MPITGNVPIRVISYLDPVFEIEIIERSLREISILIESNKSQLEQYYKEATAIAKSQEEGSWIVDMCADEGFTIGELEKILINGLLITLNSIFERHMSLIVREISKDNNKVVHNPYHTYSVKYLKSLLKKINHPNSTSIDKDLFRRLSIYTDIRNTLVHHDGSIKYNGSHLKPYIKDNPDFFDFDIYLSKVSIKPAYIKQVLEDMKVFFRKVIYEDSGKLVFSWADPWSKN